GKWIAVVERLAGPQMEDPGQPVLGHDPALGNAGSNTALCKVEPDKAVIHCGLVDGVARAPFEDRIEGLGSKRFNRENQGAVWLLGGSRRAVNDSEQNDEQTGAYAADHLHLPPRIRVLIAMVCSGSTIQASVYLCQLHQHCLAVPEAHRRPTWRSPPARSPARRLGAHSDQVRAPRVTAASASALVLARHGRDARVPLRCGLPRPTYAQRRRLIAAAADDL